MRSFSSLQYYVLLSFVYIMTVSERLGASNEDSQMTASSHGGPMRSQTFFTGQQVFTSSGFIVLVLDICCDVLFEFQAGTSLKGIFVVS